MADILKFPALLKMAMVILLVAICEFICSGWFSATTNIFLPTAYSIRDVLNIPRSQSVKFVGLPGRLVFDSQKQFFLSDFDGDVPSPSDLKHSIRLKLGISLSD